MVTNIPSKICCVNEKLSRCSLSNQQLSAVRYILFLKVEMWGLMFICTLEARIPESWSDGRFPAARSMQIELAYHFFRRLIDF